MTKEDVTRRKFLTTTSAGAVAAFSSQALPSYTHAAKTTGRLAIHGGEPVRTKSWPDWPIWNVENDEESVVRVLRSGVWSRSQVVEEFERTYAELMGAKRCLATTNGTHALITALRCLGVGVGDEVIVPPYTFVATIDVVFLTGALPIFVDTDRETFQINPDKIEEKITPDTKAILPVHILGLPANMDKINAIAMKHNLVVVEDACQAWMAEWRGKKCGTLGDLGCFSFQNSKNLTCGEGGAVLGDDDHVMDRCHSFHNFGRAVGEMELTLSGHAILGTKCRMAEFQAAILLAQMKRLEEQTQRRNENAQYLTSRIQDIPGIIPHRLYDGVTRCAYHLYPFRYDKRHFNDAPRSRFLEALQAEGIDCSGGYNRVNEDGYFEHTLHSPDFQKSYTKQRLDHCRQMNHCPDNNQLVEEGVWLFHNLLLTEKSDMDDIADAIQKIYENRVALASG
jgi:dTDP-4-amino-4,6-dideoxygalactose transaminase